MITEKNLEDLKFIQVASEKDEGIMPCTVYEYQYIDPEDEDDEEPYVHAQITMITNSGFKNGEWIILVNESMNEEANLFISDLTCLKILMGCFQKMYFYRKENDKINLN